MATRTALLNGNVINRDTDFSKHIEAVSEPGVISGFAVSSSSVAIGQAFVKCERTNGDIIYAVVYNTSAQSISGDGDVYIEIPQELIDNGELGNEDGSEIAEIKVGTMPAKNALKLAVKSGNTITDARNMIKKSGELLALINQNIEDIADLDERVEELEEAGAIDHLEETGIVGELYTLSDNLFEQKTPKLSDSTIQINVGDTNDNQQIHIQRIGSGTESNKLKLRVRSIGEPTTGLVVEVRSGVQVTVTENSEAYWYGDEVICSGSIAYTGITNTFAEIEVTMDGNFGGTKGQLLDVVVYQTGGIVNSTNYYRVGCDSTQYSEAFSYVAVNGNTRVRSKFMPYCISDGFAQSLFVKAKTPEIIQSYGPAGLNSSSGSSYRTVYSGTTNSDGYLSLEFYLNSNGDSYSAESIIYINNEVVGGTVASRDAVYKKYDAGWVPAGTTYKIDIRGQSSNATAYINKFYMVLTDYRIQDGIQDFIYPREEKNIGSIAKATLYGTHIDGNFLGMKAEGYTGTVSTGEIALGKAVGFIVVRVNGEVKKIPYYN